MLLLSCIANNCYYGQTTTFSIYPTNLIKDSTQIFDLVWPVYFSSVLVSDSWHLDLRFGLAKRLYTRLWIRKGRFIFQKSHVYVDFHNLWDMCEKITVIYATSGALNVTVTLSGQSEDMLCGYDSLTFISYASAMFLSGFLFMYT